MTFVFQASPPRGWRDALAAMALAVAVAGCGGGGADPAQFVASVARADLERIYAIDPDYEDVRARLEGGQPA